MQIRLMTDDIFVKYRESVLNLENKLTDSEGTFIDVAKKVLREGSDDVYIEFSMGLTHEDEIKFARCTKQLASDLHNRFNRFQLKRVNEFKVEFLSGDILLNFDPF